MGKLEWTIVILLGSWLGYLVGAVIIHMICDCLI